MKVKVAGCFFNLQGVLIGCLTVKALIVQSLNLESRVRDNSYFSFKEESYCDKDGEVEGWLGSVPIAYG